MFETYPLSPKLIIIRFIVTLRRLLALFMMCGLLCSPSFAQSGIGGAGSHHMHVQLVAESTHPAPGKPLTLAVVMTPDAGWHGYWINPGEAGFAPDLKWTLPEGATVSAARYPVPEKLVIGGLVNHVFNGPHALLVTLNLPAGLAAGAALPVHLKANYLVCTDQICVPESAEQDMKLAVGDGAPDLSLATQFDQWRAALPKPLGADATYQTGDGHIRFSIPYPAGAPINDSWLFAITDHALKSGGKQVLTRSGDAVLVDAEAQAGDSPKSVDAVLAIGAQRGFAVHANPGIVAPVGGDTSFLTILAALGGALLGGLILNIMPCVFPIIGLKALSLAKGGQAESQVRKEARAYTGGVILTVLALGGAMLGLRAAGHAVGWAFQLQNPWVIGGLLIVVLAITANLLGWFELPSFGGGDGLTRKGGTAGSFWTGALAAFVATPCTGPFMAAALGAALVLPTYAALMIFAGLGLGMAAPFLALGYIPALRTRLPKPGAWMNTFRRIMAIPMALTALALVWLLWHEVVPHQQTATAGIVNAQPFSEAKLADLQAHHQPAFVYFTADWCLTCKVNEKAAIETQAVADSFKAHHIAVLEGDWTNGDPAITRFLEAHGRSGVPLYLYYPADGSAPKELPQVLSVGMLTGL